ncbi:hypothetical protein OHW97_01910 [Acinetobacter baumannii]|nr:hypothetical protein [Acinetobacter baumannii]
MSKHQQELAVLLIVGAVLYTGFKTTALGIYCVLALIAFVYSMLKREKQ